MIEQQTFVIVSGLIVDIIGAGIIIIPDVPQITDYHRAGRLRKALTSLELDGIDNSSVGYWDLRKTLEDVTDTSISEDIDEMYVAAPMVKVGGGPASGFLLRIKSPTNEEDNYVVDIDYQKIRILIERQIRGFESRIRGIGFFFLAIGIFIQMLGLTMV